MREMDRKLELQAQLRQEQEDEQALTDMLHSVPSGGLVEWAMDNPDSAEALLDSEAHEEMFTERLIEELLGDAAVKGFLDQLDALLSAQGEDDEEDAVIAQIREALIDMDLSRLTTMRMLPGMEDYQDSILASMDAITALNPRFFGILQSLVGRYGVEGSALATAIRDDPMPTVQIIVHGGITVAPPSSLQAIEEGGGGGGGSSLDEEEEVDEESGGDDDDEDPDDQDNP